MKELIREIEIKSFRLSLAIDRRDYPTVVMLSDELRTMTHKLSKLIEAA